MRGRLFAAACLLVALPGCAMEFRSYPFDEERARLAGEEACWTKGWELVDTAPDMDGWRFFWRKDAGPNAPRRSIWIGRDQTQSDCRSDSD
jgi:hypothetical protein